MKKKIEIASWPRRSHYEYFQTFECPMFSITSHVRVDALYCYAKQEGISFFVLCLFVLLKALNEVPQLRQRVEEGEVWEYESVDALVPVLAADGEFTQILVGHRAALADFWSMPFRSSRRPSRLPPRLIPAIGRILPCSAVCRGFRSRRWPAPTGCSGAVPSPHPLGEGGAGRCRQADDARGHSGEPCTGGWGPCW